MYISSILVWLLAGDTLGAAGWLSSMVIVPFAALEFQRMGSRKLGTSTAISVSKRVLRAWLVTNFLKFAIELLIRLFEILKDYLASFMFSRRFSPKIYFESEVSLSHSVIMPSFKTGFELSLRSSDICLCLCPSE